MKIWSALFLSLTLAQAFAHAPAPLHLDPSMETWEYQALLKKLPKNKVDDDPAISKALAWGQRLSAWVADENTRRAPEAQLRLTSPQTRRSYPVDKPSIYSEKTIAADLATLEKEINAGILAVVNGGAIPATLPVNDDDFVAQARRIDRVYQSAARFKSLNPYRSQYAARRNLDVRAYYFFSNNGWTAERVADLGNLPEDQKALVRANLAGLCVNGGSSLDSCKQQVARAEASGKLADFYKKAMVKSKQTWDGFFSIPGYGARTDVVFTDAAVMTVPFNTPSIAKFGPYLQDNVEDEWKWTGWNLRIAFGTYANGPYLTFETGVVPHVNGLGGNEITMDSNQPIEEYESKWTIRHEFGHVLGFPDCYHEFFDVDLQAFVNYQLDVSDLMCSRAGNMKERLYNELVRVYKK